MGVRVDTEITEIIEMGGCFLHDVCLVFFFGGCIRAPTRDAPTVYVCFDLFLCVDVWFP